MLQFSVSLRYRERYDNSDAGDSHSQADGTVRLTGIVMTKVGID